MSDNILNMPKKKQIAFTIADAQNKPYADMMINSLRKFHDEEELPIVVYGEDTVASYNDPAFFYRATPLLASHLMEEYEFVLKMDADQIVFGNLDHILYDHTYDVGTVLNINRVDPPVYGIATIQGLAPNEYYNAGLVAMRNQEFVEEWKNLCLSKYFERFQYKEQDLLNIIAHFGRFNVKCFDSDAANPTWNGLVAKGETIHAVKLADEVVIPKGQDNYPDRDTVLKVLHQAGGHEKKMNWRTWFTEDVQNYVEWLISNSKEKYVS